MGLGKLFNSKPANGQKVAPDDRAAVAVSTSPTPAPAPATGKEGMLQSESVEGHKPYPLVNPGYSRGIYEHWSIKLCDLICNVTCWRDQAGTLPLTYAAVVNQAISGWKNCCQSRNNRFLGPNLHIQHPTGGYCEQNYQAYEEIVVLRPLLS